MDEEVQIADTELSFLIKLLLTHKLPNVTKTAIAERISVVEKNIQQPSFARPPRAASPAQPIIHGAVQSASTAALFEKHPDILQPVATVNPPVIAQNPITAKALQDRQEMINAAQTGQKFGEGTKRTSPRKW